MEWVTSSSLLRDLRSAEGGRGWEQLVRRFRVPIVRFARRLGIGADEAEDVAQETLLAFMQSVRSGRYDRERARLSTWLFGIASRHVMRARRGRARRPVTIRGGDDETGTFWSSRPAAPAPDAWAREWDRAVLALCLERARFEVRPATWRAFEIVVIEGRPAADAAEELDVALTAVYNAKHRVIRRVRELRAGLDDDRNPETPPEDSGRTAKHS